MTAPLAPAERPYSARLSLRLVLVARLLRSRTDAICFALAELDRPGATLGYKCWLTDFMAAYGGNLDLMMAAAPASLTNVLRRAAAIPELALPYLPSAEDAYHMLAAGYKTVPAPEKKQPPIRKSNLWMQLLEPAGQTKKPTETPA